MPYNLLRDPLFPVVTASGASRIIPFIDISEQGAEAPVDFDWPRPDLNIASYEFCIGILTILFQPDTEGWSQLWARPVDRETLEKYCAQIDCAFNLDGEGPRFMQAFEPLKSGEPNAVEGLFIDTPGINGQNKNTDLLTHRGRFSALGFPAAAMTLYAMQQFAPSGGAGNRTSMRGGGPMTTLIVPTNAQDGPASLWHRIIANLPILDDKISLNDAGRRRLFPWLVPTLTSDKASGERKINPDDAETHPLHAFFGMPRRIHLVTGSEGVCGLTGLNGPLVTGFVQKPWGMNYGLWEHPLTPYRQQKEDSEPYSVKPKSGRFGYRDWVSVTQGTPDGKLARASANIRLKSDRSHAFESGVHTMTVAGWAMSNMEAIAYLYAEQPLYLSDDKQTAELIADLARRLAKAGDAAHDILRGAVRRANFSEGAKPAVDGILFLDVRRAFYGGTERDFHDILGRAFSAGTEPEVAAQEWRQAMRHVAIEIFERFANDPSVNSSDAERFADAYKGLRFAFSGFGKAGKSLFEALGLPVPKAETKSKKESA